MVWSRVARMVGAVATVSAVATGCSASPTTDTPAVGSHSQSHTQGMLTYWVKWHVDKDGIRIEGFRARFTTCHHVWIFFSECRPALVKPMVSFAIYAPRQSRDTPLTRLWGQTVRIPPANHVVTNGTPWLPKGSQLATTFPPGSYFGVQLYAFNDWNSVQFGGDQYYRVANANGGIVLG